MLLTTVLGGSAQSLCGCPTFLPELSNESYLRFKSQCPMEIEEVTVVISDDNYIMTQWLGEWYDGSFYNTALTQADNFIPYNLDNFAIFVDGTMCIYQGWFDTPTFEVAPEEETEFEVVKEDTPFKVYTIEGRYLGEMLYKEVFQLHKTIYILKNGKLTMKVWN